MFEVFEHGSEDGQVKIKFNPETLSYWQNNLSGVPVLDLPADYTRRPGQRITSNNSTSILSPKLSSSLRELCAQENATVFMLLLSAFKVLLYRYTGQDDFCVGTPVAGGNKRRGENSSFVNKIAIRSQLTGDLSFRDFLSQVRETTLSAYKHQDTPFEQVIEYLGTELDPSRNPVFQVMFDVQNRNGDTARLFEGNEMPKGLYITGSSKLDIILSVVDAGKGGIGLIVEYDTSLFASERISRLLGHYRELLGSIVSDPNAKLSDLNYIVESERSLILEKFNSTFVSHPEDQTILDLFESQVALTPDQVAIAFGDQQLSYHELNVRANQLAHCLLEKGVTVESLVSICLNRSVEMIIGIIGILKAGGAYVPIDPSYPAERISYILKDIGSAILLGGFEQADLFSEVAGGIEVLFLDKEQDVLQSYSSLNISSVRAVATNLAYVIYTSGSTGRPKGVMIEHGPLVNFILCQSDFYGIRPSERILQFSNYSFDASVEQMFISLCNGATLVLFKDGLQRDIALFEEFLHTERITHLHATPSFLENLRAGSYNGLKRVISAGEACSVQLASRWREAVDFYNKYGPTETTISVAEYHYNGSQKINSTIPIGRPVWNTQLYVLDDQLRPCGIGISGELCVGGIQVARGYLNQTDLTSEKFIVDPFGNKGNRMYRTGDRVRWLEDGNLEYQGRIDDQVKIRGYRIELGEIESVLGSVSRVDQNVIVAHPDGNGGKRLVAYVVAKESFSRDTAIAHLRKFLPEFMVPALFVTLESLPMTRNGKIDKRLLSPPELGRPELTVPYKKPVGEVEEQLTSLLTNILQYDKIGADDNFFELGANSLLMHTFVSQLKNELNYNLSITKLYQYPTISGIAKQIGNKTTAQVKRTRKTKDANIAPEIAVIGMAGRFPGADGIDELWKVLTEGRETTSFFSPEDLDESIPDIIKNDTAYVKARGIINNASQFDPAFFGINTKLAELMDPQQRVFLELTWGLLEETGHLPSKYHKPIGVFAGSGSSTYLQNNIWPRPDLIDNVGSLQVLTVNEKDYISSRTAYHLNLKGPAVSVNSACSTSLLAIVEAVNSLRSGQCDAALAGGVAIKSPINSGHLYQEGSMLSADGHCRPFDNNATGTVFSDGAGVVLLKRLEDAEREGDRVYAVIKGVGLNNDGGGKGSFTAPSTEGQAEAILSAMHDAGVEPHEINYIEAHGTGTPIGDPIEFDGLLRAFGDQDKKQYCAIGSVKSNFGHLTHAAGVVGFIKTCLALHYGKIPPSLGFEQPNKNIDFDSSPFYVNTRLSEWNGNGKKTAGVSSFGVGGTNVHVILQDYQYSYPKSSKGRPFELINWSAKSPNSLDNYGIKLKALVDADDNISLADIAYTLQRSRDDFRYRRFLVADTTTTLAQALNRRPRNEEISILDEAPAELVFVFPGQGAQYVNMASGLYKHEAVYRNAVDQCAELLIDYIEVDIRKIIFNDSEPDEAGRLLQETRYTQPALFVTEYALAKLWMYWGITPTLLCGHSVGEYVAAHLAGVFTLEDGLKLIAKRSALVNGLPPGRMLSVREDVGVLSRLLDKGLSIAAINSPKLCVVSGEGKLIEEFESKLTERGIVHKRLMTSHAFHSEMMDPVVNPFRDIVSEVSLSVPRIPIMSTVTGNILTDAEATDPGYWAAHLRKTVDFAAAIDKLIDTHAPIFLEIGPGAVTSTLINQIGAIKSVPVTAVSSLKSGQDDHATMLSTLGRLWSKGFGPDWNNYFNGQERAFRYLPPYQFDRQKYWVEPAPKKVQTGVTQTHLETEEPPVFNKQFTMTKNRLTPRIRQVLEDASGIELANISSDQTFIEMGFDSLLLTQVAISLKREFNLPITFRKLNEEYFNLDLLTDYIASNLTSDVKDTSAGLTELPGQPVNSVTAPAGDPTLAFLTQQLEFLTQQVALIQNNSNSNSPLPEVGRSPIVQTEELNLIEQAEIKKPFGAAPKIERTTSELSLKQQSFLKDLTERYNSKTIKSKQYAERSRSYMSDPRVVSGFKPVTKELVYPIVVNKSEGSRLWDLDGNEYIDALNGFGSNMLGYRPEVIKKALHEQIENGFEVGPQHELAAEVSQLICEFTGFERAALCSTGSEAVLGCIRIARTVTGRSLIVAFTGSYHGIIDEVLVRGTKKLKSFPAVAGIMPEAVQNILVLDYGTKESLDIIRERANEIAAVLVEPVQSRRPEFVPVEFLKEVRQITRSAGTVLIFDEVITGFRFHPGGAQAIFGIRADIASYGKVVGAGIPIGIIAGKKEFMDALDGGSWQYGDQSYPEVGVTYFAGTFVRHPLALASAKASLEYMKLKGLALQQQLNEKGEYLARNLNAEIEKRKLPIFVANYGSLWRIKFLEEIPFSELMFTLMREKGIHILDGFSCFLTEAMSDTDLSRIISVFADSMDEMIEGGFFPSPDLPNSASRLNQLIIDANNPPVKGARLGKDKDGNPGWFVKGPDEKYVQIGLN